MTVTVRLAPCKETGEREVPKVTCHSSNHIQLLREAQALGVGEVGPEERPHCHQRGSLGLSAHSPSHGKAL